MYGGRDEPPDWWWGDDEEPCRPEPDGFFAPIDLGRELTRQEITQMLGYDPEEAARHDAEVDAYQRRIEEREAEDYDHETWDRLSTAC